MCFAKIAQMTYSTVQYTVFLKKVKKNKASAAKFSRVPNLALGFCKIRCNLRISALQNIGLHNDFLLTAFPKLCRVLL